MGQESKDEADNMEQGFKNQVFASDPKLYNEMFNEENLVDEDEIDYISPENDGEFKKMMRELSSYGIID